MTTERDNCGLGSLLPMSCRGRAEAFARSLHSRLSSLGSQQNGGNGSATESSWLQLGAHEPTIALSQPRHSSDSEMYLDFGLLESPSPEEDIEEAELHRLLNKDNLKHSHSEDCHCSNTKDKRNNHFDICFKSTSNDSDSSDGPFYDTENDLEQRLTNGVNGHAEQNGTTHEDESPSDTTLTTVQQELSNHSDDSYATTTENTVPLQKSLSEETSTLSLKDDDTLSSEEINGSLTDIPQCEEKDEVDACIAHEQVNCNGVEDKETYISSIKIEKDFTVECPKIVETSDDTDICQIEQSLQNIKAEDANETRTSSEDEQEERIPRVRRCSSLKTGKTPPGTPGRKKIVRFADVLGLDLADVRTFLDEIPKIPNSAFDDLRDVELNDAPVEPQLNIALKCHGIKIDKVLLPLFQQPGGLVNFLDLVRDNNVCLENAIVDDPINFSIKGSVRVRNLDFNKSVHIRYTLDAWKTFHDVQATYVQNSCDGFSDRFTFYLYARSLSVGQRLEFAVRFQCKGCQYWDSNKGVNYCFQCLPATSNTPSYTPITGADVDHWGASFY